MINEAKVRFGRRLELLLETTHVMDFELQQFLKLKSIIQVQNYLKGRQTPTFERMAMMRILFGCRTGEIDGSEPFPLNLDREAIRKRLEDLK